MACSIKAASTSTFLKHNSPEQHNTHRAIISPFSNSPVQDQRSIPQMPRTALVALTRHSLHHHRLLRHPASAVSRHHVFATPSRPLSMSSSRAASSSSSSFKDGATDQPQHPQGLPAPGDASASDPITLDVSGEGSTVKLAALGPLVVNVDGTVARIANWKEMTAVERETTLRMVGRRNQKRLDALRKQKEEEQGGGGGGSGEQ